MARGPLAGPGRRGAAAHRAVATPVTFGGIDASVGAVPGLGEHTAEVLAELTALDGGAAIDAGRDGAP